MAQEVVLSDVDRVRLDLVLDRHDLLDRNPAKRPRSSWRRFAYAQPRDCYQIDATHVRLADHTLVAVFDVLDDCTRTLVACHAAAAETADAAITAITTAFQASNVFSIGDIRRSGAVLTDLASAPWHTMQNLA